LPASWALVSLFLFSNQEKEKNKFFFEKSSILNLLKSAFKIQTNHQISTKNLNFFKQNFLPANFSEFKIK